MRTLGKRVCRKAPQVRILSSPLSRKIIGRKRVSRKVSQVRIPPSAFNS